MQTILVNASKTYPVIIGHGAASLLPQELQSRFPGSNVCFVSDDTVASLHLHTLRADAERCGIRCEQFVFPHGETSKNPTVLFDLLEYLAQNRFTRKDVLVALGGGVTGDLTGLASALYMRGMRLIQMPTTLLSMVDSSVGGKTAVNLKNGKNLAGVFHQPDLVLCDLDYLDTLPEKDFADGMAEVIKYGVIADEALFALVKDGNIRPQLETIVTRCVTIKRDIVAEDEFDTGKRALLNFGHTFAHAIEAESRFSISHGSAVAMGMIQMAAVAARSGFAKESCTDEIAAALSKNHLPTECPFSPTVLFSYMTADKKCAGDAITIILPLCIGHCIAKKVPLSELKELISA